MREPRRRPRVGVVIVNHDKKALLQACLESWSREGYGADLLVSDNDSTDGALEMLRKRFPKVAVLSHVPEIGFAAAASAGLRKMGTGYKYLFLTTNDTAVQPGLLAALVAAAEADPRVAVVGPKINYFEPADRIWHAGGRFDPVFGNPGHHGYGQPDDGRFDAPRECLFVSGCGLLLRTAAAAPLGYFRGELAFYAEDSDLCLRLREAGWKVVYEPKGRMYHHESATLGVGSALSTYYITRNSLALLWRHRLSPLGRALPLLGFVGVVLPWRALKALWQAPQRAAGLWRASLLGLRDFALGAYGMRDPKDPGKALVLRTPPPARAKAGAKLPVAVVVLNWNGKGLSEACLASWAKAEPAPQRLLLVDNGSQDGSVAYLKRRFKGLEVLALPDNLGFAAGNNRGFERLWARGPQPEAVFVCNNDTEVAPDMLGKLWDALKARPDWAGVGPRIYFHGSELVWFDGGQIRFLSGRPTHLGYGLPATDAGGPKALGPQGFVTGCGFLVRSGALRQAGGFDERLWAYAEDADLCFKLREAGWGLGVVPRARMSHRVSSSFQLGSPLAMYFITRNSLVLLKRRRLGLGPLTRAAFVLFSLARVLRTLRHGQPEVGRAILRGLRDAWGMA